MNNQFEINWDALKSLDEEERINAMWYLLQSMQVSINENIYNSLSSKGKQYFKLK